MHVLITGGAGFIGSHLAELHLARGDKVHVVDDLSTGSLDNVGPFLAEPNFRFDEADMLVWPQLERAAAWADRIYHLAAVVGVYRVLAEPTKVLAVNIAACERLLRAVHCSGWKPQVVLASSSEVYGHNEEDILEETQDLVVSTRVGTRWNYSVSKIADEALGLSYARRFGIPTVVSRFFNTVGPRQSGRYGMVIPRFVEQAVRGEPITVFGSGEQTRSFCDVRDTVVALDALAAHADTDGLVVNVGNDREISMNALAELVRQRAGSQSEIVHVPYKQAYGEDFEDIRRRRPSLARLRGLTGFQHRFTLERTIDDLIEAKRAQLAETEHGNRALVRNQSQHAA
ncbi:NAD-dependent epimerase/dehydratase family protein [Rehaibacterium terrae]|uniref:UDP-glucose 4-epimerase n=1 Tax=Rehaibacterium terrae TaxID=1341696 RepID=A0A7W8DF43_9GAMM|nr:UDP-glucose 4-epimerase [Rehaibacterium terrae]